MKTMIQSLVISLVIHLIYIAGSFIAGYIETRNYIPDIASEWENTEILQSEVAFGVSGSPLFFLITFIGVALISGLIIVTYKKIVRLK